MTSEMFLFLRSFCLLVISEKREIRISRFVFFFFSAKTKCHSALFRRYIPDFLVTQNEINLCGLEWTRRRAYFLLPIPTHKFLTCLEFARLNEKIL